jgi:hypothetical protein
VRVINSRCWPFVPAMLLVALLSWRPSLAAELEEESETKVWQEVQVPLPPLPQHENLLPINVSAATQNEFFVDVTSITVTADGVVRYVLVIRTPGGATNISFEGLRCETRERRLYASGRPDGSWSKSRSDEWKRIRDEVANRYHAALFGDYFCPEGVIVRNVEEARDALRRGRHPESRR